MMNMADSLDSTDKIVRGWNLHKKTTINVLYVQEVVEVVSDVFLVRLTTPPSPNTIGLKGFYI